MKQIKKRIFSLSVLLILAISMIPLANADQQTSQKEWYSYSNNPTVKAYIKGSFVYAQISTRNLEMPASKLKSISGYLLNEYGADYIHIEDLNHNGRLDIGILTSVGYGGSNPCYAVFEYSPSFYVFKTRSRKTICLE